MACPLTTRTSRARINSISCLIVTKKFFKRSASSAGMCSGAWGIVPELERRRYAFSNALRNGGDRSDVLKTGHRKRNTLVQSDAGAHQLLCASGVPFNNLVVHAEEGIRVDSSSSRAWYGVFLLG